MPDRGYRVVSCQACQCKNRNGVKAFHNIPAHLRSLWSRKTLGAWLANCLHREAPHPSQLCYCQTQPISLSNEAVVKASESLQSDHERLHYISLLCLYVCLVLGCITLTLQQSWSEYVWMTNIRVLPLFWRTRIHSCAKWSDKRLIKLSNQRRWAGNMVGQWHEVTFRSDIEQPQPLNHISKILLGWLQTLEPVGLHDAVMGKKERREYCSEARRCSISNAFLRHFLHLLTHGYIPWGEGSGRALNRYDLFESRHAVWWFQHFNLLEN